MVRVGKAEQQKYKQLQKKFAPPRPLGRNLLAAFVTGGAICVVGEAVRQVFIAQGMSAERAATPTAAVMVFLGSLLTGLGLYDRIGKFGGMGAALPITGFANAIVSAGMEFKREGWVMGVGARMFVVAGPVIVYGLVTSFAVGLIYYLLYIPR